MKKKFESPIKNEKNLRRPGQKLEEDFEELMTDKLVALFIAIAGCGLLAVMEWYRWFFNQPPRPILYTLIFIVVLIICSFKFRKYYKAAKNIKQGLKGERFVAGVLDEFKEKGCKVFHDFPIEYGNIDHVVINQFGIFTIETKTLSKQVGNKKDEIFFDGKNVKLKSGRYLESPIEQAKTEAKCLRKVLNHHIDNFKIRIQPIVVYPKWMVIGTYPKDKHIHTTWVVNQDYMDNLINSGKPILERSEIKQICNVIEKEIKIN